MSSNSGSNSSSQNPSPNVSIKSGEFYAEGRRNSHTVANKKGKLKKKGFWSHWKECWVVLEGNLLLEYKSETSSKPSKVVGLDKCTVKLAESVTGTPHSFVIVCSGKDPLFLCASNEAEQVEWVAAIKQRCQESSIDWGTDKVLEAFLDPVVQASEKGIILGANEAFMQLFGYTKNTLIGRPLTIIMPPEYAHQHDQFMATYLENGIKRLIGKPRRLPALKSDGSRINIILSLGEVFSGGIRKFVATLRADNESQSTDKKNLDSMKSVLDDVVNQAVQNAGSEIKNHLQKHLEGVYKDLENFKMKTKLPIAVHNTNKKQITLNPENIQINERLADNGGSGATVYGCTVDGFICAMKELDLRGVDRSVIDGLETEINLLESLPYHRNLLRYLFHTRSDNKIRLFTTKYSTTLAQLLQDYRQNDKFFDMKMVIKFALDIIKGLEVLHQHNIIHRDLKSDNIFVTLGPTGEVDSLVVADFDTAKMVTQEIVAKTTVGTPGYISPEILRSNNQHSYTFSADIWSWGMVLYEIMSLQRPFTGKNIFALTELTLQGALPQLTPHQMDVYADIMPLWERCLRINPEERPTTPQCKDELVKLMSSHM